MLPPPPPTDEEFCGVIVALSEKSVWLLSVSAKLVRLRDFTSVLPVGAVASAPSNVFDAP